MMCGPLNPIMPLLGIQQIKESGGLTPLQDIQQLRNRAAPSQFISGKKEKQTCEKENNTTGKKTVIDKSKFKTEMCKNWIEKQQCNYGDKCKFAHGKLELNEKVIQEKDKYKSKKCQSFYSKGYCLYGVKCLFKHEDRKLSQIFHPEEPKVVPEVSEDNKYQLLLRDGNLREKKGEEGLHAFIKSKIGDSIKTKLNIFRDIKNKNMSAEAFVHRPLDPEIIANCAKRLIF